MKVFALCMVTALAVFGGATPASAEIVCQSDLSTVVSPTPPPARSFCSFETGASESGTWSIVLLWDGWTTASMDLLVTENGVLTFEARCRRQPLFSPSCTILTGTALHGPGSYSEGSAYGFEIGIEECTESVEECAVVGVSAGAIDVAGAAWVQQGRVRVLSAPGLGAA